MNSTKLAVIRNLVITILTVITSSCYSQVSDKNIFKKYIQADSSSINKSSVLLFYKNNTFINYGVMSDFNNDDVYIWFTSGTWKKNGAEITCKSMYSLFDKDKIMNDIKEYYKNEKIFNKEVSSFDFEHEKYMNYSYVVIKDNAFDITKKIYYIEVDVNDYDKSPLLLNVFN